jgi:hypothetical protein
MSWVSKDIYFGIALGVNVGDFKIIHSKKQRYE